MLRQFAITGLLGAALLLSQGGSVLVAALCPHLRSPKPVCDMSMERPAMDHSEMAHHGMVQDASLPPTVSDSGDRGEAIRHGDEPCSHCAVHSRSDSSSPFRMADVVKRSTDLDIPDTVAVVGPVVTVNFAVLTPRDHDPPGQARPRHLLINTFRI